MTMVSGIVLAAGLSTRMGQPKQLLPYGKRTVIEQVVAVLLVSAVCEVVVVTGHAREAVEAALANWPVRRVFNPDYAGGEMLSSVQVGLRAADPSSKAALLALGDMPGIEHQVVNQLVEAFQAGGERSVYIPSHAGRAGHPVLVPRPFWERIWALPREASLRDVLRAPDTPVTWVTVDTPSVLHDIDTPADYEREGG